MSNMKCPFCNKPLQPTLRLSDEYWCENYDCPRTNIKWVGSQKLWQELIRTRKALEMTDTALLTIATNLDKVFPDTRLIFETIRITRKRIAEITALEQKDVK